MKKLALFLAVTILLLECSACSKELSGSDAPSADGRTELVLATDSNSAILRSMVRSFNDSNDSYSIKTIEYGNSKDKTIDTLRTEIIAGNAPDIYALSQGFLSDVKIPIYEDLLPYLDADAQYGSEALVSGLYKALTKAGSLYYIPSEFFITSFTARKSIVGERTSITMEEANTYANAMGTGTTVFPAWLSRENMLAYIVNFSLSKFLNPETGECDFLNPEFTKLLEQCKSQESIPSVNFSDSENSSLLQNSVLQTTLAFIGLRNMYGTDYCFVGFPTDDGSGSEFNIGQRFSISSQSKHKDVAWEFVRSVMSEENQRETEFFPSTQAELEKRINLALEGDPAVTEAKLEPEEADKLMGLINSITLVSESTNSDIYHIISDEASAYFLGQNTVEETVELIQNRVSLYLAEKS